MHRAQYPAVNPVLRSGPSLQLAHCQGKCESRNWLALTHLWCQSCSWWWPWSWSLSARSSLLAAPSSPPRFINPCQSIPSDLVSTPSHCDLLHPRIPPTYLPFHRAPHALHLTTPHHTRRWVQTDWDPDHADDVDYRWDGIQNNIWCLPSLRLSPLQSAYISTNRAVLLRFGRGGHVGDF